MQPKTRIVHGQGMPTDSDMSVKYFGFDDFVGIWSDLCVDLARSGLASRKRSQSFSNR